MLAYSNGSTNYTTEEIQQYLSSLQHESTLAFIPALIYLSLLIVVGSVGNCLVLVVYSTKMTRTPLRIYIISMAVFDLPTNILVIPGEIYDMFHIWDFDEPNVCKVRRYLNAAIVLSSGFVLVAIATTRYKMVCNPLGHQVTITQAKVTSVILAITAFVIAIPYGIIHGTQTIKTPNPKISGRFCEVDDTYVTTVWPNVNSAFFILLFIVCSLSMIGFYVCIARKTWQHRREQKSVQTNGNKPSSSSKVSFTMATISERKQLNCYYEKNSKPLYKKYLHRFSQPSRNSSSGTRSDAPKCSDSEASEKSSSCSIIPTSHYEQNETSLSSTDITFDQHESFKKPIRKSKRRKRNRPSMFGKTSCMMITVSLFFFFGFVPFLALNFYKTALPESHAALEGVPMALYHLFLRSYLINCAVNPLVYSLLDRRFRRECFSLFKCNLFQPCTFQVK